jgi:hypothetical protein
MFLWNEIPHLHYRAASGNARRLERQSRCPTGAGVGRLFKLDEYLLALAPLLFFHLLFAFGNNFGANMYFGIWRARLPCPGVFAKTAAIFIRSIPGLFAHFLQNDQNTKPESWNQYVVNSSDLVKIFNHIATAIGTL